MEGMSFRRSYQHSSTRPPLTTLEVVLVFLQSCLSAPFSANLNSPRFPWSVEHELSFELPSAHHGGRYRCPASVCPVDPPFLCLPILGDRVFSSSLQGATSKSLPSPFPNPLGQSRNPRVEFYDMYGQGADEYDNGLIMKYGNDLNITLVPVSVLVPPASVLALIVLRGGKAALLSAVTSAFIIDIQRKLEPDYQEMNYRLLAIVANVSLGNTPTGVDAAFAPWNGPDPTIIRVQAFLYASLAASLLVVLVAMLGNQWLNRYSWTDARGSVADRCRHRQRKMEGMVTWHFDLVMECLPLMLQAALLLLSYALSDYLFSLERIVASTIIAFAAFGVLFYLLLVSAATMSYNCPFQTPLSLILRFLIRYDSEHKKFLERLGRWFGRIFSRIKKNRPRRNPRGRDGLDVFHGNRSGDHIELPITNPADQQPPLFNEECDWYDHVWDSKCIARMFDMSMDADALMTIMRFIPEVVWHAGIRTTPLERLYDTVVECIDRSSGSPVVIPQLENKVYLSAKAFLHVAIQRKCVGDRRDEAVLDYISRRHHIMGSEGLYRDSDLQSTLGIIDCVFGYPRPMDWKNFSFTAAHHAWMGHILLYRAWDVVGKGGRLPEDIKGFTLHSLQLNPLPPAPIVADCLFIIGLVIGIGLHIDDLLVVDKRWVDLASILHDVKLNLPVTVADPTSKLTGSTISSPRCSTTALPQPMRLTVL